MRFILAMIGPLLLLAAAPALAEEPGDALRGKVYAGQLCAECHAVEAGAASPNPAAVKFADLDVSGRAGEEFAAWLNTGHPVFRGGLVKPSQVEDILAHIRSLAAN
jgi:mono/diheme cytochrome c family protein